MATYVRKHASSGTSQLATQTFDDVHEKPRHTVAFALGHTTHLVNEEMAQTISAIIEKNKDLPDGSSIRLPINGKMFVVTKEEMQEAWEKHGTEEEGPE